MRYLPLALLPLLAACGGTDPVAENLENAAEVSEPAAAAVLENAAEQLSEQEGPATPAEGQQALEQAAEAQAKAEPQPKPAAPARPKEAAKPEAAKAPEKAEPAANSAEDHSGHEGH